MTTFCLILWCLHKTPHCQSLCKRQSHLNAGYDSNSLQNWLFSPCLQAPAIHSYKESKQNAQHKTHHDNAYDYVTQNRALTRIHMYLLWTLLTRSIGQFKLYYSDPLSTSVNNYIQVSCDVCNWCVFKNGHITHALITLFVSLSFIGNL